VVFSTWPQLTVDTNSNFNVLRLTLKHHNETFLSEAIRLLTLDQDLLVIVDPGFKEKFQWLRDFVPAIAKQDEPSFLFSIIKCPRIIELLSQKR
jgi:hypothetical protein